MDLASSADENPRHIVMMINSQIKFVSRALGLILSSLERLQRTGRPVCVPHTLAHARTNATCKKLLRQSRIAFGISCPRHKLPPPIISSPSCHADRSSTAAFCATLFPSWNADLSPRCRQAVRMFDAAVSVAFPKISRDTRDSFCPFASPNLKSLVKRLSEEIRFLIPSMVLVDRNSEFPIVSHTIGRSQ